MRSLCVDISWRDPLRHVLRAGGGVSGRVVVVVVRKFVSLRLLFLIPTTSWSASWPSPLC